MVTSVRIEQRFIVETRGLPSVLMQLALVIAGIGVYALSAQFKVVLPFTPVPVTGQTFALFLLAGVLGQRLAVLSAVGYLGAGFAGLPIFAGGAAGFIPSAMSFGYLFGLVAAAWVMGFCASKGWLVSLPRLVLTLLLANIALYVPGIAWMGVLAGFDKPLLAWGLYPFLLGDILKIALAFTVIGVSRKALYH